MSIVPIVLLAQVVFSGAAFELQGPSSLLARLFPSRWSMSILGQTTCLNALGVAAGVPDFPKLLYGGGSAAHVLEKWLVLAAFSGLFLMATYWTLRRRDT